MGSLLFFSIYFALSIVLTVIGLFFGNIILFDSILLAALSGLLCNTVWSVHPAFCLLIGIAVFLLLLWLQHTSVGFWLIGGLLCLLWSAVFGIVAYFLSANDPIWGWVVFGLALAITGGLHIHARSQSV